MNIFKVAFKVVREKSPLIYNGFGFKHLSDATECYVSPENSSVNGKTTMCQPVGEAVWVFADLFYSIVNPAAVNPTGDFYFDRAKKQFFIKLNVREEYREHGVVEQNIFSYMAYVKGMDVTVGAYDADGRFLHGTMEHLHEHYKLLPAFCVLLAREIETNEKYRQLLEKFIAEKKVQQYVQLCEDFYQTHKNESYNFSYGDVSGMSTESLEAFSSGYEVVKENRKTLSKNQSVEIKTFDGRQFSEEQKKYIPSLSQEFVLPENLQSLCNAVSCGDIYTVLLHGPAGTGKTMSCKLMCQAMGLPLMETINCTENLDEFVLGKYMPEDDRIVFRESFVTKAIREGGAVVFEEINFAKPQYLSFLNSLLDDNGFVRLDNGEVVHRHKNFRFFATMNIGYFGTKELNQALYNRFNSIVEIAALSDEAIECMLTTRVPECGPFVEKMLSVYHKLQKKIQNEELDVVVSPRNLENWARLAKYEGYLKAAEKTIVPVAKCDRSLEQAIRGILLLYKW